MAHEGDFVVIPIGMAIMIVICCICGICLMIRSKSKTKERKLKYKEQEYQYMQGERERQREQERQRELEKQRERERHQAIMAQFSQLQQSRPYYPPPPPPVPAFEQVYPPPPPIGIRSQVMAPQLPPPLPPSAMPSSSSFSVPTAYPAVPRTTPGWNTDALQSKPQPGILITPKEDPTTKSVTINMAPAVVRPVSPPKRNARPLLSLRERANQKLNRSSSSSRSGSYASERDSRSGSRRHH